MASTTFSGPVTSTAGFISGSDSLVSITATQQLRLLHMQVEQ